MVLCTSSLTNLICPWVPLISQCTVKLHHAYFLLWHKSVYLAKWWSLQTGLRIDRWGIERCRQSMNGQVSYVRNIAGINSSPPGQNGRHFADDIFKRIFMNVKSCILIPVSLQFVTEGPIDIQSALVQVMAWHPTGDKPLPTSIHVCATRERWVHVGSMKGFSE